MKLSNYIESTTPTITCEGAKLAGYVPKRSEKLVSVSLKSKEVFADVFWWSQEFSKVFRTQTLLIPVIKYKTNVSATFST